MPRIWRKKDDVEGGGGGGGGGAAAAAAKASADILEEMEGSFSYWRDKKWGRGIYF